MITGAEIDLSVQQSWLDANLLAPNDIVVMHHVSSGGGWHSPQLLSGAKTGVCISP